MPPNSKDISLERPKEEEQLEKLVAPQADPNFKFELHYYKEFIFLCYVHLAGIYGLYLMLYSKWMTFVVRGTPFPNEYTVYTFGALSVIGISLGGHRLYAHKAFKANVPVRIFLMLCHSIAFQNSIYYFGKVHRQHHKYSDTDGDPHNATRGVFYSHVGWFIFRRHPEMEKRIKYVDVSDLKEDPVLMFQKKYLLIVLLLTSIVLPVTLCCLFGETFNIAYHTNILRIMLGLNFTFSVNSLSHKFGTKPYDKNVKATQLPKAIGMFQFSEQYHNFHHAFPWDYRNGEISRVDGNFVTKFVEWLEKMGWVWDLKTVDQGTINIRAERTGDGTRSRTIGL